MPYSLEITENLAAVDAREWNRLVDPDQPFLRHEFLTALEKHGCVGEHWGWVPQHLILRDAKQHLVGAVPLYLKFNSYGEFVFDWAWADAYQRHGMRYYPKLVSAVPYTPASGPRLLAATGHAASVHAPLELAARELAEGLKVSSLHWLFTPGVQTEWLREQGYLIRQDCQFHWHNQGYADFDAYLATFNAKKRKNLKRERRHVREAGITFRLVGGNEASADDWACFHRYYTSTFERKGGAATLTLDFFQEIGASMGEHLLLVFAMKAAKPVAAAFNVVGDKTLYGRHWGCDESYHSLHFEACYYQGLEYCIDHGLTRFEPGAQGEHKVSRGFLPTPTWSAHWLREPHFRDAIARFLALEAEGVADYMNELSDHSPFRRKP